MIFGFHLSCMPSGYFYFYAIKKISNLFFKLNKENKAIKDRIIRDIRNLFEQEAYYYKQVRVGNN